MPSLRQTPARGRDTALALLQRKHDLHFGELRFFDGNLSGPILSSIARFSLIYFGRILREEVKKLMRATEETP